MCNKLAASHIRGASVRAFATTFARVSRHKLLSTSWKKPRERCCALFLFAVDVRFIIPSCQKDILSIKLRDADLYKYDDRTVMGGVLQNFTVASGFSRKILTKRSRTKIRFNKKNLTIRFNKINFTEHTWFELSNSNDASSPFCTIVTG